MRHRPNYFANSESAKKKSNDFNFNTLPKTNISPEQFDPWNLGDSYWKPSLLGAILVSGSVTICITCSTAPYLNINQIHHLSLTGVARHGSLVKLSAIHVPLFSPEKVCFYPCFFFCVVYFVFNIIFNL